MTETTLLVSGMFCFGLTVLGVALTMFEFNKPTQLRKASETSLKGNVASVHALRRAA